MLKTLKSIQLSRQLSTYVFASFLLTLCLISSYALRDFVLCKCLSQQNKKVMSTFVPIFLISKCQVLLITKIVFYLENATKNILSTKASLYWKVYKFNKSNSAA